MAAFDIKRTYNVEKRGWYLDDTLKVGKLHPEAQELSQEDPSDPTWQVTLIGRTENRIDDPVGEVCYFNTGLKVTPPNNFHIELIARDNLHKAGYEIPSGTIVVRPTFNGELQIPLRKFKETADIELPYQGVELILRETVKAYVQTPKPARGAAAARRQQDDDHPVVTKVTGKKPGKGNHMF